MSTPSNLLLIASELLLKSSVILLAAALATYALRRSSAAIRHVTWSAALFAILLVPLLSFFTPRWAPALISASKNVPIIESEAPQIRISSRPNSETAIQSDIARLDHGSELGAGKPRTEFIANAAAVKTTVAGTGAVDTIVAEKTAVAPAVADTVAASTMIAQETTGSTEKHQTDWQLVAFGIWAIGTGLLLFQRGLGSLRLRLLRKSSPRLVDLRAKTICDGVLAELGIDRAVEVRTSTRTLVPMTWGTRHPVLLLPIEALDWSDERIDAAIRHEAAHIARRDYFTNFGAQVACAFYWPNPLVWMALRSLHIAQEQAADDFVIRAGTVPERYAYQLLDLARKLAARSDNAAPYSIAMARPSTLESRMLAIMDEQRNRCPISMRTATTAFVPVVLGLALCSMTHLMADVNVAKPQVEKEAASNVQDPAVASPVDAYPYGKIVIHRVDFTQVTLTEAVDFLRVKAREQGADSFRIVIPKMPEPEPRVTLSLSKSPILHALQSIAGSAGMQVRRDSHGFVLENERVTRREPIPASYDAPVDPFAKITFNKVDFKDVTLTEAVDFLRKSAKTQGADTFNIVIPKMPDPEPRLSMHLYSKVPMTNVVRYVAQSVGLQVHRNENGFSLQ